MTAELPPVTNSPTVLVVVPARGGSRGLPGKNTRILCGLPLIGHAIRAAQMTTEVERVIVSTDSESIADTALALGADVPFIRPTDLAGDTTPMAPVVAHAVRTLERLEGTHYDAVLLLDPTSPVRDPDRLSDAISLLWNSPMLDGVVSISQPTFQPEWVGVRPVQGTLQRYFSSGVGITRRQDADRYLRINGNFYVWRSRSARSLRQSWFDEGVYGGLEIPESQAFSIDDEFEFRLVEALIVNGIVRLPWMENA